MSINPVTAEESDRHPLSILEHPVAVPAKRQMNVEVIVNDQGDVWVLHDMPFAETVKWAEYDLDYDKVWLVLLSGRQQELGLTLPDNVRTWLRHGRAIFLVHMKDGQVADSGRVSLIVRSGITQRN